MKNRFDSKRKFYFALSFPPWGTFVAQMHGCRSPGRRGDGGEKDEAGWKRDEWRWEVTAAKRALWRIWKWSQEGDGDRNFSSRFFFVFTLQKRELIKHLSFQESSLTCLTLKDWGEGEREPEREGGGETDGRTDGDGALKRWKTERRVQEFIQVRTNWSPVLGFTNSS